jgi:hypothetical protein
MDYKIVKTFSINSFEAWGGAVAVINRARETGRVGELEDLVECAFDGYDDADQVTDSMINDFIWFYADDELDLWNENDECAC